MKGCRTDEDMKKSTRDYFRKERKKRKQRRSTKTFNQSSPRVLQPQQAHPAHVQPQIIYTQPQQPVPQQQQPIIIQPQTSQQPSYQFTTAQQPQSVPRQRQKSKFSRFVLTVILVGIFITGVWMYQGGLNLALQNWTGIFHEIKILVQQMIGVLKRF